MSTKFIFVTGGVLSSLGKGLASASIGALLESRGLSVTLQKLDPYINVDAGTMNPFQHGEVYVTDDGAETDLDLGHYERFADVKLTSDHNVTTGKVYNNVIQKERRGDYLGKTVQVIPHITDEIKRLIFHIADNVDVAIVEVGGTVGDIESLPFLEAIRQFPKDVGVENVIFIHLTLVPYIAAAGELKTKPTQHSVAELREIGIQPHILLCRTDRLLSKEIKQKISLFCNVHERAVITAQDVSTIYEVPLLLHKEGLDDIIVELLGLKTQPPNLKDWENMVERIKQPRQRVEIAVVGKYLDVRDSYKSLMEAIHHGGIANDAQVVIRGVDAEKVEKEGVETLLAGVSGILVPGGFGSRGIEGKIMAINYARTNGLPFLGICLGMQLAVVEFARHVVGLKEANSTEFNPGSPYPVIDLMAEQKSIAGLGGTMRLGAYPCRLFAGTKSREIYGQDEISERHRHRYEYNYEFNQEYREIFSQKGLTLSGFSPDGKLVEMIELKNHPWFVAGQFHPEFKSKPHRPHPLFAGFIRASLEYQKKKEPSREEEEKAVSSRQ